MRQFLTTVVLLIVLLGTMGSPMLAAEPNGAELFDVHCVGCHPQGKNIIRRGKTLKIKALQRNQLDSVDAIATLVTNGKNNMSAYKDTLSASEITAVSTYVLEQAQQGWR